ncbi:MAG: DUF4397 domain-containing protein [Alcanivoracaceae bacterium]|jgi:hypothetical protein|nr:DUF4397 domain-containing protein [Alcanivoracaceae bacterium]
MRIWKKSSCASVLLSAALLTGCGGDSSFSSADLRVIHAAGNAPAVNVNVNGGALAAAQDLSYSEASSLVRVRDATYSVSVDGILPDNSVSEVLAPTNILLNKDQITTVVAMGNVGASGDQAFAPLVIDTLRDKVAADSTRVQVVHASVKADDAAPAGVSVYLTAPDAVLAEATPVTTFNLREFTDALTVPAGDYRIRVTPAASSTVVFDSGTVTLPGGADLMILAVDSFSPGSPVKLLVSTGDADADFIIADANMPAELRVVHAASGVGPADVFASSTELALDNVEIVDGIGFRNDTSVGGLSPATDYTVRVNADDAGAVDAPIEVSGIELKAGSYYTAVAAGNLPDVGEADLALLLGEDDRRGVATEVRLRAIHAASLAGTVTVFVTPAGNVDLEKIEKGDEKNPALPVLEYQQVTPYLRLSPGSYDVRVAVPVPGNNYDVTIDLTNVALAGGDVVTLVASNPGGGDPDFDFVILND